MVAKTALSIDFPEARLDYLTRFLTVEISSDRVAQISVLYDIDEARLEVNHS